MMLIKYLNKKNITIRDIRKNYDADKILRDIRTLLESDEEDYYKPIRTGNAFNRNYIEYENMKVIEIKMKHYQVKTILIKSKTLKKLVPCILRVIT